MISRSAHETTFQSLVAQHEGILFRVTNTYATLPEDQQDLLQEIRIQLWKAFPKYDPARNFSTWAYRVALNTAISWFRRHSANPTFVELSDTEPISIASPTDKAAILRTLIDQLNSLDRAILTLHLDDIAQSQIAEIVGISNGNVATKLSRIKAKLRNQFESKDTN